MFRASLAGQLSTQLSLRSRYVVFKGFKVRTREISSTLPALAKTKQFHDSAVFDKLPHKDKIRSQTELIDHYFERGTKIISSLYGTPKEDPRWYRILRNVAIFTSVTTFAIAVYTTRPRSGKNASEPKTTEEEDKAKRDERIKKMRMKGGSKQSDIAIATTKFTDIHGIESVLDEIKLIVDFLNDPEKYQKIGARIPNGILLYGPPGTGKTLLARAIAGEANVPLLFANGASFDSMFVGSGSRKIRELFEKAREIAPCVIYIDELDGVAGSRQATNSPYSRALNQLLTELDGFHQSDGIVFIGSTNLKDTIDTALLRPGRIDKTINVPLPDVAGREKILKHYLSKVKLENPEQDISTLAAKTTGFSGAELRNLVNQAAILAVLEGSENVNGIHLANAYTECLMGVKRPLVLNDAEKELVAYHEAGKALVSYFRPTGSKIYQVTIIPRGNSMGSVHNVLDSEVSVTSSNLHASIDQQYAGYLAEEMIYGKENVSLSSYRELEKLYNIALNIVEKAGFTKLGFVGSKREEMGDDMEEKIDAQIAIVLKESKERVQKLLGRYKVELQLLAAALIKYETLTGEEVEELIKTHKIDLKRQPGEAPTGEIEQSLTKKE